MQVESLLGFLHCLHCRGELKKQDAGLVCTACSRVVPIRDGVPRFAGTTDQAVIQNLSPVRSQKNWTRWRTLNYVFFEDQLRTLSPQASVLDLGAGSAPFYDQLKPFKRVAVDMKPWSGIDFLADLTRTVPLRDESFDAVIMSNVLEHFSDPERLLKECFRILKPGGRVILTVPFLFKIHQAPHDYLRYTEHMLRLLFRETGLNAETIQPIGNVFDVFDHMHRAAYFDLERSATSPVRTKWVSVLRRISQRIYSLAIKISGNSNVLASPDTTGYPQGYGCVGVKNAN